MRTAMMASPLILCHTVLLLLQLCCLAPSPSSASPVPDVSASISKPASSPSPTPSPPSPSSSSAAIADTANSAVLEQRETLVPETLNSVHLRGTWGPPLIVGSDGAQRFFDRLHGFYDDEEKPVALQQRRAGSGDNNSGSDGAHDSSSSGRSSSSRTTTKADARSTHSAGDANEHDDYDHAQQKKNWILRQATRTFQHSNGQPTIDPIELRPAESRQMLASLSDRIISQLSAGNPWVNWTQSTGPVVVHSVANLPIGQFPFVVVQPTVVPPAAPAKEQKPPRRGWFSFQRPWQRIYGEGTESKFPAVLEGVVQRIQHYFSVFKYEDESRPYVGQWAAQAAVAADTPSATQRVIDQTDGVNIVRDELITPAVINGIEIEVVDASTKPTVRTSPAHTTLDQVQSTQTEETPESTIKVDAKVGVQRLNEIAEMLEKELRRNDKIIKIDRLNDV